jgi:protein involved in polysaccharide export with SLBB domain
MLSLIPSRAAIRALSLLVFAAPVVPCAAQSGTDASGLAVRAAAMHGKTGDRVAVKVYGEPAMSDVVTIDEMGRITLPRIGTIMASAMTLGELRDTVRARLARFLNAPAVDVAVLRRIVVAGEVARPAVYYADLTTSIGEIIAQAGGLRESGHPNKVVIIRGAERIPIQDWVSNQTPTADLRSGDQVFVGRRSWLELNIIPVVSVSTSVVALIISLRR